MAISTLILGLLAAVLATCVGTLLYLREKVRHLSMKLDSLQRHVWESANVIRVLSGCAPFPLPGDWAASTDILGELARTIATKRPLNVVELGSGLSTLVIAAALKRNGAGRVVSIDGDEAYAQKTRDQLALHGLAEWSEVRHAGIDDIVFENEHRPWYKTDRLLDLREVDLLFVDGPPSTIRADIRYPSLPWFWDRLRSGAYVIVDDAGREAEQSIRAAWQRMFPRAEYEFLPYEKGALRIIKKSC